MNYYIADTHFGHKNVMKFDNRPFANLDEMEKVLINNWNTKIKDTDDVYIIGDFCFRSDKEPTFYLEQLNGRKHFIIGNHDHAILKSTNALNHFISIEKIQYVRDGKYNIVLCHFPIAEWNGIKRGALHIYGHIHANRDAVSEYMGSTGAAYNAGCMLNNYAPVTIEELIENNKKVNK